MGMDRNTVIGFVLLAILLFLYLFISSKNSQEFIKQKKIYDDSIALINSAKKSSIPASMDSIKTVIRDTAGFKKALYGSEQFITVENNLIKVIFSNKGGRPTSIFLKNYLSYNRTPVQLMGAEDKISYPVNTSPNQIAQVTDLFFSADSVIKAKNGDQTISYHLTGPGGEVLTHQYIIQADNYAIDWNIQANGVDKLFSQGNLNINWHAQPVQQEKYAMIERQATNTNICFSENNEFDYISSKTEKKFEKPIQWVSVSQQFFSTILRAKNSFNSGEVNWVRETVDTSHLIAKVDGNFQAKFPAGSSAIIPLQLYYGPNDFYILKKQAPDMDRIVNLGRDLYSFVRPVNIYIIMPVFNFFKKFIGSYGVVIMLLTLFIRLLTSPLIYKSYLSGAKMKVLRPEMDALKKKHGTDQQAYGMEQMKLFREAGVNPLGGCIPALLQIPIFFALYSFFNSNIVLRGESFLWAKDLSVYDSIINLGFSIPFYGNHVSLFTLLAVATSFLISLYGMSNAPDQNNPALKYMPYIFPVLLLGFFNKLPSALTWYYTVSNVITLVMQWVIQTYIINHDKILAKIEETRKKPKTKSKWQERMEQMQQSQQKLPQQKSKIPGK